MQEAIKTIDIVDSMGYRAYLTEGYGAPIAAGALQGNSDWQDLILETGTVEDYNLSVSGGSEETRFFASMTYHDNEGILRNSRFRRYVGRLNLEHFANERFSMGMNLGFTPLDHESYPERQQHLRCYFHGYPAASYRAGFQ